MTPVPIEEIARALDGRKSGDGYACKCPCHDDRKASLSVSIGEKGVIVVHCHAGCAQRDVIDALKARGLWNGSKQPDGKPQGQIVATYDYRDQDGKLISQAVRYPSKNFKQRRPDGAGGWIWDMKGVPRLPYRLPEVLAAIAAGETIHVVEGEKDCDNLCKIGIAATCNAAGAGKWHAAHSQWLKGAKVIILPDNDDTGRDHAQQVAKSLAGIASAIRIVELPGTPHKGDVSDWIAAGGTRDKLIAESASRTVSLTDAISIFQRWLYLPDADVVLATFGAIAANLLDGDPVWLLLVGPPGSGKTEVLQSLIARPWIHPAATLTVPSLLSGTPKRDRAEHAHGGLLRQVGSFGVIMCKDFGSVLSMHRDARAEVLAALRELYDGSWTRHVGTDGGKTLSWEGKCGLIGGCTPHIDRHHAVMGSMGERFLLYRMPDNDNKQLAERALSHAGKKKQMRAELRQVVAGIFERTADDPGTTAPDAREQIIDLATLVARCRSSVERDGYSRDIELIPDGEVPTRLALQLERLHAGMRSLGASSATASRVVARVALDSMPRSRRRVIETLQEATDMLATQDVAEAVGYPTTTARRTLEDLAAHGIVARYPRGKGASDAWSLSKWAAERWITSRLPETSGGEYREPLPETSGDIYSATELSFNSSLNIEEDISGKQCPRCGGEGCAWCDNGEGAGR